MPNYWVVGASWGGVDHQDEKFLQQGIWMLGHEDGEQAEKASKIQQGDRIAIKRMKGRGQRIKVLHLGIVKSVILEVSNVICVVDWVATHLDRDVPESRGCYKSVHGPFEHDEWVEEVFCL